MAAVLCLATPSAGFLASPLQLFHSSARSVGALCRPSAASLRHLRRLPPLAMMSNSLNAMTVAQLREKLAELGDSPPSKLRKADLIARVQGLAGGGGEGGEGGGGRVTEAPGALDETVKSVEQMTVGELKEALKARGLKVGGNKPDLVQRLQVAMSGISSSLTDTPDAAAAKEVSGDVLTVGE